MNTQKSSKTRTKRNRYTQNHTNASNVSQILHNSTQKNKSNTRDDHHHVKQNDWIVKTFVMQKEDDEVDENYYPVIRDEYLLSNVLMETQNIGENKKLSLKIKFNFHSTEINEDDIVELYLVEINLNSSNNSRKTLYHKRFAVSNIVDSFKSLNVILKSKKIQEINNDFHFPLNSRFKLIHRWMNDRIITDKLLKKQALRKFNDFSQKYFPDVSKKNKHNMTTLLLRKIKDAHFANEMASRYF